ncbi:MAG: hypothetical protein ACLFP1_03050 [Candidatus Goldiibacteriota bacterium]
MKRIIFILTAVWITTGIVYGEKTEMLSEGDVFPELVFEKADGNIFVFPDTEKNRITLLAAAFSRPKEGMAESWILPFENEFKGNERINYYETAMLGNLGWLQGIITGAIKGAVEEDRKKNTVLWLGDGRDNYKKRFGVSEDEDIYIFLIDTSGKIRYMTKGNKAKKEEIEKIIEKTYEILERQNDDF